jgi:hypothetical protein
LSGVGNEDLIIIESAYMKSSFKSH